MMQQKMALAMDLKPILEGLDLVSLEFDTWILIMKRNFDFLFHNEPYHALQMLFNVKSGQFICRHFGKSFAHGTVQSESDLLSQCNELFSQTIPCMGTPVSTPTQNQMISNSPISYPRLFSHRCKYICPRNEISEDSGFGSCEECSNFQDHCQSDVKEEEEGLGHHDSEIPLEVEIFATKKEDADPIFGDETTTTLLFSDSEDIDGSELNGESLSDVSIQETRGIAKLTKRRLRTRFCPHCGMKFTSASALSVHQRDEHPESLDEDWSGSKVRKRGRPRLDKSAMKHNDFKCTICDKICLSNQALTRHLRLVHFYGNFKCLVCPITLNFAQDLTDHMQRLHLEDSLPQCPSCKELIAIDVDTQSLVDHYKTCIVRKIKQQSLNSIRKYTEKRKDDPKVTHQCDLCGKTFSQSCYLKNHRIAHHGGELPFKCKECDFATVYKQSLQNHVKLHLRKMGHQEEDGQDPLWFYCDQCGNKYVSQDSLKLHIRNVHDKIIQHFPCQSCDKIFQTKKMLLKHTAVEHTKQKFPCQFCGKVWPVRNELSTHVRVVHTEAKFKCRFCDKKFKKRSGLLAHERIHTGENPYKCPLCDYTCKSSATLSLHKKFIHNSGRNLTQLPIPALQKESSKQLRTGCNPMEDMLPPAADMDSKMIFPMEELTTGLSAQINKLQLIPIQSDSWVSLGADVAQSSADLCKVELEEDFDCLLNDFPSDLDEVKPQELETTGTDRDDYSDEEDDRPLKSPKLGKESGKSGSENSTKGSKCSKIYKCHALHRHNVRHHGHGKFACPNCPTDCASISAIFDHVRLAHPDNPKLRCASCEQKFDLQSQSDFEAHYSECVVESLSKRASVFREKYKKKKLAASWKSHQCDLCGDTFSTNFLLKNHRIQKHTKDFPYKCEYCAYGTVWKQGYEMHRKTHLRDKGFLEEESKDALWFFCEKCGNKFSTKDSLKYHVLKVHEKVKERLECKDCEKVFANRVRLSRHRIIEHSTDPKYQCEICGYRGTGTDLKIHKKTHEAPQFKCKYCGKGIKSQTSLICHERIHTGENPFKCPFCEYTCKSSATLCLHKKFIHNDGKNLTEHPLPDTEVDP
eukprot:TCALIF_04883-PA protein Name:"Similar to ZNF850 Zinc finger protein 850 (Homo sapiens)" AED:0.09 eAED:0.09 QI:0/0.33/0.14/0.85/0.5/0.28/7/399/1084